MSESNFHHMTNNVDEEVVKPCGVDTSKDVIKSIVSVILLNSRNVDGEMVPYHGATSTMAKKFDVLKQTPLSKHAATFSTMTSKHTLQALKKGKKGGRTLQMEQGRGR
jgi:hypothetical protein